MCAPPTIFYYPPGTTGTPPGLAPGDGDTGDGEAGVVTFLLRLKFQSRTNLVATISSRRSKQLSQR